jgi:hypothetical protein
MRNRPIGYALRRLVAACGFICAAGSVTAQAADRCDAFPWGRFIEPGPQSYSLTDRVVLGPEEYITTIVFDELAGEYAKVYLFAHWRGDCLVAVVSIGSYAFTNVARPEDVDRIYHADLYASDSHATLGFYENAPPPLDEARALALDVLTNR